MLDPFCGCGTTVAAAQKLKRQWIGIDITHLAITLMKERMKDTFGDAEKFKVVGEPVSVPLVVSATLVSVRLATSALSTAASFVPRILTVTLVAVPSALATANTSVYVVPATNSVCAWLAV